MPKIFISYRRDDSDTQSHFICKRLRADFGADNVFIDVDAIPLGVDFAKHIKDEVNRCDVLLVVIGDRWLDVKSDDGSRRIDNAKDFVSIEIHAALERGIPLVPVILRPAKLPRVNELPAPLAALAKHNASFVGSGRDFDGDVERMIRSLRRVLVTRPDADATSSSVNQQQGDSESPLELIKPNKDTTASSPWMFDPESASIPIKERIAAADALGREGDPRFSPSARQDNWITIPARSFLMKSTGNLVELDEFRIARYPVTVAEYAEFVQGGNYHDQRWWSNGGFKKLDQPGNWHDQNQHPTRPVTWLSWFEAAAYAAWLSTKHPAHCKCRLLTEAEWELAAGGTDGCEYPWGNDLPDNSRLNSSSNVGHVTPVGLYPGGTTSDGIHELAGNVWEWCLDWCHDTPPGGRNPVALKPASRRVNRGGAWYRMIASNSASKQ